MEDEQRNEDVRRVKSKNERFDSSKWEEREGARTFQHPYSAGEKSSDTYFNIHK